MRLPVDGPSAKFAKLAALTLALALGAWGTAVDARRAPLPPPPTNGPQADYPVVVGEPYTIDGTEYVPEDVLNYDRVGVVAADEAGGNAVSGAHHTLPLPSYIEVTSLDTGRTVLVRIERRGPMTGQELVALSPGAFDQLGVAPGAPVRVRRVNPPEDQRALLRAGQAAPLRMDTPMPLVEVLRRKLPGASPAPVQVAAATPAPQPMPVIAAASPREPAAPAPTDTAAPGPLALPPLDRVAETPSTTATPSAIAAPMAVPARAARAADGDFIVQAAAFSTADRATRVADALGGEVSRSGRYFRVRTGPFATRSEAEASLAKVRAAGYRDARIFTSG
jgi:rare lipoprotein A